MGRFKTVYADPPWNERGGGKIKRGADRHYNLLKTKEIPAVMMNECPYWTDVDDPAHLYLWVTNNYLPDGLWVMNELGFRYVTNLVWTKDRFGLGQYRRGQHELLLFGVRGRGIDIVKNRGKLSTWIGQKALARREHSQKPQQAYETIEDGSPAEYLEIFARSKRQSWTSWGEEVP